MRTKRILELIGLEGKLYESQNSRLVFAGDILGSGLKAVRREGHEPSLGCRQDMRTGSTIAFWQGLGCRRLE